MIQALHVSSLPLFLSRREILGQGFPIIWPFFRKLHVNEKNECVWLGGGAGGLSLTPPNTPLLTTF